MDSTARWWSKACMDSRNDTPTEQSPASTDDQWRCAHKYCQYLRSEDVALTGRAETELMAGTKETQRWSQIELDNETSRVARASS
ncbi:hypothetical protein ACHAQJ_010315, partial [Trichoderma viride]